MNSENRRQGTGDRMQAGSCPIAACLLMEVYSLFDRAKLQARRKPSGGSWREMRLQVGIHWRSRNERVAENIKMRRRGIVMGNGQPPGS